MMRVSVDAQIVGEVISAWTGIPLGKMVRNEIETVLTLDDHLKKRVIGQDRLEYFYWSAPAELARPRLPLHLPMCYTVANET